MKLRRKLHPESEGIGIMKRSGSGRQARRLLIYSLALIWLWLVGGWPWPAAGATVPVPSNLTLTVREMAGVSRTGELVRSGVPLPRSLKVLDPQALTLVAGAGTPVPAEFQVLARWDAGRSDTTAPIQWLLITFRASVSADGSATYRLVTDGSAGLNPSPPVAINLTQVGNQVTVNTGEAIFTLGGNAGALFDEVRLANGTRLIGDSTLTARAKGGDSAHSTLRRAGDHRACGSLGGHCGGRGGL